MGELTLSALDEKILLLADRMSPEEIAREIGNVLSPARIHNRIREMLKTRDWLSAAEQDALVIWKMRRLLGQLETSYLKGDLANVKLQLDVLKTISKELEKRRAATQDELNTLYANQAQIVFDAIRAMIDIAKLDSEARQSLREALPEAVYVLTSRNAGEAIEA